LFLVATLADFDVKYVNAMDIATHSTPDPSGRNRREHLRIAGPFDALRIGLLETPLRIFDLSRGGCFINALHTQKAGQSFGLKIELPGTGWISVKAETLDGRSELGFAVRFVEISDADQRRLDRALSRLESTQL
jgi:hypothetical protein